MMKEEELSVFRRRNIGFVFQAFNLLPELNVEENILLPILLDYRKPDKQYINELLEILGLMERKHHLPSQLSGGQQQRVAIGRALATNPAIILADEPTGNLDSKNSKDVINLLKLSVDRYNQTLIMITHNQDYASFANRVLSVDDGIFKLAEGNAPIKDNEIMLEKWYMDKLALKIGDTVTVSLPGGTGGKYIISGIINDWGITKAVAIPFVFPSTNASEKLTAVSSQYFILFQEPLFYIRAA